MCKSKMRAGHSLRMDSQRRQEFGAMASQRMQEFADECARRQMNALGVEVCVCMIFLVCMFLYGVPIGLYVLMGSLQRIDYKFESASRGIVVQLGNFDDGPRSTPKFENLVVRAVEPSELRSTDLNLLVRARVPQGVNPDWVSQ